MLSVTPKHKVYLAVQAIDFRRGIDGLSALCRNQFAEGPFSGHYFIFRNRRASAIKILIYDSQGFCLFQKRLSKGTFRHWPKTPASVIGRSAHNRPLREAAEHLGQQSPGFNVSCRMGTRGQPV